MTFVSPDWYRERLAGKFDVIAHHPGRLMRNQDVYLLLKTG